jgi:hypothetical protein
MPRLDYRRWLDESETIRQSNSEVSSWSSASKAHLDHYEWSFSVGSIDGEVTHRGAGLLAGCRSSQSH